MVCYYSYWDVKQPRKPSDLCQQIHPNTKSRLEGVSYFYQTCKAVSNTKNKCKVHVLTQTLMRNECLTFQRWLQGLHNSGNHSWCVEIHHLTSCWTVLKTKCLFYTESDLKVQTGWTQRKGREVEWNIWNSWCNLDRLLWTDLKIIAFVTIVVFVWFGFFVGGISHPRKKYSLQANFAPLSCKPQSTEKRYNSSQSTYFIRQLGGAVKWVNLEKDLHC